MSQKKMEAYKEAKKNKRQIEKKQKRKKIFGWIIGILIAAALIAGSVFLVYYTSVIRPAKQQAELEAQMNNVEDGTLEGLPESIDPSSLITIPADSVNDDGTVTDDTNAGDEGESAADNADNAAEESSETDASATE